MYFCGKALNKLAQLTLLATRSGSQQVPIFVQHFEKNLLLFVENRQRYPLVYEKTWGGIVSSQGFTERGDGSDFGNSWYNDHHYHYSYHIAAVAIFLELCPHSPHREKIAHWARDLVRDVASPTDDAWFPAYRSMDWFVGHSWSKGLYESADGKDEESTSEDYMFTYVMYLFGKAIGDVAMQNRAILQLAVQASSIQSYMLFAPDNDCVPTQIKGNCVSGIKFENKIDYVRLFLN